MKYSGWAETVGIRRNGYGKYHLVRVAGTRGRFPFKQEWQSICSFHAEPDPDCELCRCGTWKNALAVRISGLLHDLFPGLWIKWMNRGLKS
jgi:hypothetical protein